jgi:hypothetical protein
VSIILFGDYSHSKENKLKLNTNQSDIYTVDVDDDLGTIFAIKLKFYGPFLNDINSCIDLKTIKVINQQYIYYFECNQVFSLKNVKNSSFLEVILLEKTAQF